MCGRFTQNYTWAEVHAFLSVFGTAKNLRPRYNIAPTTPVDVVRLDQTGRRELVSMRWGLVPFFWKKTLKEVPATFNARAETMMERAMYRDAFKRRRCVIPASGFFEWTGAKGSKVPHLFSAADGSPILAFAGLWDRWSNPETGEEILSCTIIVSSASDWMASYHDRMPVLLRAEDIEGWLDGSLGPEALRRPDESALREWIVSSRVNRTGVGDDDPSMVEPSSVWHELAPLWCRLGRIGDAQHHPDRGFLGLSAFRGVAVDHRDRCRDPWVIAALSEGLFPSTLLRLGLGEP